jgi:phenylacetate-CoA ligase
MEIMMSLETTLRKNLITMRWLVKKSNIERIYDELMEREYWTKGQWQEYQGNQLRSFVKYCYENVPYYREKFDLLGLSPKDIITFSDLQKIPILTKEIIRENANKLIAGNNRAQKLIIGHTTGSTGTPLTYYKDNHRNDYLAAGLWRIYRRCGWQPGERIASIWGFGQSDILTPRWKKSIRGFLGGNYKFNAWKSNEADFAEWFQLMRKQKVTVIVCYASTGSRFANWLLDNNIFLEGIKGVYCTSEKI